MKILHVCLASFYIDEQAYQENMLPKFHKELGYEVEIVASLYKLDQAGGASVYSEAGSYINEHGIKVTRLEYRRPIRVYQTLRRYVGFKECLEKFTPDIIFIHGCQFLDINIVKNYAKKNKVKIFIDNHADFSNSATNWLSKRIKHGYIWKKCAKKIEPYVDKFYGVLPARVDFLKEVYGISEEKCDLLVMGADDELVNIVKEKEVFNRIRERHGVLETDFLIVSGGKINQYRPETLNLMKAVADLKDTRIKLIIFGTISDKLKYEFEKLCENPNIIYVGWIKSQDTYQYIAAANLVVFPGLHSVMWEQAVAIGKPCVFRSLEGFHHVDLGGNAIFVDDVTAEGLKATIEEIYVNNDLYDSMVVCANEKGMKAFSYKHIAEISVK